MSRSTFSRQTGLHSTAAEQVVRWRGFLESAYVTLRFSTTMGIKFENNETSDRRVGNLLEVSRTAGTTDQRVLLSDLPRKMHTTCVRVPFGGCVSSNPEEARAPRWQTPVGLALTMMVVIWLALR